MNENPNLCARMRAEDAEQFFTLVRMHLSFVLDLNGEDCDINSEKKGRQMKWNLPFSKKAKGATKPSDGSSLTPELVKQMNVLIHFLSDSESLAHEGIFRRTGKLKRQQDLKAKLAINEMVDLDSGEYSVHDCASVLKTCLSELPEPLLTEAHYPAFCQVAQLNDNEDRLLLALQLLILLLPVENRAFLQQVLGLLQLASQHADTNRMSATNLATLFTPHLLWPRRLAPESLQANSQALSRVVAFMIEQTEKLFLVPDTLATDIRVYWEKKERRRRSPGAMCQLNESVCDGTTASTVFTFVDRERSAQPNGSNLTELALAQLYAHIQSLPDSARKRHLVKNFNKNNGQGTPAVRNEERNKHRRSRSLRDSIKKHLPGFGKNGKTTDASSPCSNDSTSPEPLMKTPLLPASLSKSRRERPPLKQELLQKAHLAFAKENRDPLDNGKCCVSPSAGNAVKAAQKRPSPASASDGRPTKRTSPAALASVSNRALAATKAQSPTTASLIIPSKKPSKGSLPRSAKRCPPTAASLAKALKPTSPPDINQGRKLRTSNISLSQSQTRVSPANAASMQADNTWRGKVSGEGRNHSKKPVALVVPRRTSPRFHTPTPVSVSNFRMHEHGLPVTNPLSCATTPQRRRFPCTLTTSTPAMRTPGTRSACLLTPQVERNSSMSPITRSAQRMPRAMQETMMTPRSRKPVVSLSGSDLCHLTSLEPWTPVDAGKRLILEESESSAKDSLSSTFRDYLVSRSVLTASPVDLSFSSRTDDFQSLSGKTSSLEELQSLADGAMSESLLFCMDGNDPDECASTTASRRPSHVCETAI